MLPNNRAVSIKKVCAKKLFMTCDDEWALERSMQKLCLLAIYTNHAFHSYKPCLPFIQTVLALHANHAFYAYGLKFGL